MKKRYLVAPNFLDPRWFGKYSNQMTETTAKEGTVVLGHIRLPFIHDEDAVEGDVVVACDDHFYCVTKEEYKANGEV